MIRRVAVRRTSHKAEKQTGCRPSAYTGPMKSKKPLTLPSTAPDYPSLPDLTRRGFLIAAGSLAAAGLLVRPARAQAQKRVEIVIRLPNPYTFRHGNQRLERLAAQTADSGMVAFLASRAEADGIQKTVLTVLEAHSCVDLGDGKRLAALQVKLGQALANRYQLQTRRRAAAPTVTIFVGLPVPSCRGKCAPPVPYCQPPRP